MDKYDFYEKFEPYEQSFVKGNRPERRQQKKKLSPKTVIAEVPAQDDRQPNPNKFNPSYMIDKKQDNQERLWLIDNLQGFYETRFITDVVGNIKAGKEASVYCCIAHPSLGIPTVAAKVYRPAFLRSLKNDALYREGRFASRDEGGIAASIIDGRTARAIHGRTSFGRETLIQTWIAHEFETMTRLYQQKAHVPRPIGHKNHAILMEFVGEETTPAPTLHHVHLEAAEAQHLFLQLINDVQIMLREDCVHGDLSAYNILYWDGTVKIIDFPQAVNPWYNPSALPLLTRDLTRLCQYFAKYQVVMPNGQPPNPAALAEEWWTLYLNQQLK